MAGEPTPEGVVDLLGPAGTGPLWGMASAELNATLLVWPPGHEVVEETPSALDVLVIVLEGGATAKVDDLEHGLVPGSALLVKRGRTRMIRAGPEGVRYLSVHRRRGPLQLSGISEHHA
jgi:quercetin dioxygenase-like cupin family protein